MFETVIVNIFKFKRKGQNLISDERELYGMWSHELTADSTRASFN